MSMGVSTQITLSGTVMVGPWPSDSERLEASSSLVLQYFFPYLEQQSKDSCVMISLSQFAIYYEIDNSAFLSENTN